MCKSTMKLSFNIGRVILLCSFLLIQSTAVAKEIKANNRNGKLQFSGEHAGMEFTGEFLKWDASIMLPPFENPRVIANFSTASAKTGDATYDETLPEEDWFYVEKYPNSTFTSDAVERVSQGYKISGVLELRGKNQKIEFILKEDGNSLQASFTIDRLAFDIGKESDPEAEWVSKDINVSLMIRRP